MSYVAATFLLHAANSIYYTFKLFTNIIMKSNVLQAAYYFKLEKIKFYFSLYDILHKKL